MLKAPVSGAFFVGAIVDSGNAFVGAGEVCELSDGHGENLSTTSWPRRAAIVRNAWQAATHDKRRQVRFSRCA
jgi:hypothetical protein